MSDNLETSGSRASRLLFSGTPGRGVHQATASTELFSAALQQFATTPANRGAPSLSVPRGGASRQQVECDSEGFVDSDEEDEEEEEEKGARVRRGPAAAQARGSSASSAASSSSSSSSDSAWGTFHGGEPQLAMCNLADDPAPGTDEGSDDGVLFVPDPIFDLSSLQNKPVMPCLHQDQIPIGATVWVVDEDDVATQLNCYFSAAYPPVCNGRLSGTVVRHSGLMTLVRFDNQAADLHFALCVPTSCLSLDPVEPYESSPRYGESYGLGSGAYGMLGPRAVGRGQGAPAGQAVVVTRYLYEAMPAYDAEKLRGTALEKAQELFFQGSFEKALTAVNEHLGQREQSSTQGCGDLPTDGQPPLADIHVLRSRIFIFLERYSEALNEARISISLEPQWVRGYLSVARAHCGLGQFTEAAAAIAHAYIMLPYSSELERIKELNGYMHSLQSHLRAEGSSCYFILDGFYRKRLRVSAATAAGVSLCKEVTPIVATHSVFAAKEPLHRCSVCFRQIGNSTDSAACSGLSGSPPCSEHARMTPTSVVSPALSSPVGMEPDDGVLYCSTECSQRASLYRPLEIKHRAVLQHVRSLILSKGAVTLNVLPLEMASLTVRLFLMVVTTHRRLCAKRRLGESSRRGVESTGSRGAAEKDFALRDNETHSGISAALQSSHNPSPSPPVYVETALQRLGVYPLCTEPLKSNKLDELKMVYDVLTTEFKPEERATFSFELLSQLYSYVSAYFTPVDLNALAPPDATGRAPPHHTVYYLPNYVGCIEVAKTISYTATSRRRDGGACNSGSSGDNPGGEDALMSRVMGRPSLEEPVNADAGNNGAAALAASNNEANCAVVPAPRPALLELVAVAPIEPERKLRCVPVSMALSSDVA